MNSGNRLNSGCSLVAVLALAGLAMLRAANAHGDSAAPEAGAAGARVTPADRTAQENEIDRQHLQHIYQAITAFYRDHRDLPNWLSDLVPEYLADTNELLSPVEIRTGKSVLFGRDDPKYRTSYIYEFNAGPAAEEFNRGRTVPLTCKEWKLMQLQKFGLVTPILRCHLHKPVLNVAYTGEIYETGLLWEDDPNTAALIKSNPRLGPQAGEGKGPQLSVRVVDADTGEAVGAAAVRSALGSEFGLLPPAQVTAGTNGTANVMLGDWKVNFLFLTVSHPLYQAQQVEWNREKTKEGAPPTEWTIKLARKSEAGR